MHTIYSKSTFQPISAIAPTWERLVGRFAGCFTVPSFQLFSTLLSAWVLCPGRRTVTRMITIADPDCLHAHDAYHRLLRLGAWSMAGLWHGLTLLLVEQLELPQQLLLLLDDTLFHKSGRKVHGAGNFRDPIRSSTSKIVYALGLNLVVLCVRLRAPWGGEPLALPVNLRLYRKGGPTHLDLAETMIIELSNWLPSHRFILCGDGAYASLAARELPRTHFISRIRKDAAVYDLAPARQPGQRGRPRKKGARLPALAEISTQLTSQEWAQELVNVRGQQLTRLLYSIPLLWYAVCPHRPLLLVIVRDPNQRQPDDFFFSTDLQMSPQLVATIYADRWSIEDTFRNTKQQLGGQDPQCWRAKGPERAAALSLWSYSVVWLCYLLCHGADYQSTWIPLPWYSAKRTPSFADALAILRRSLWTARLFHNSRSNPHPEKIPELIIDVLAQAA